MKKRWVTLCVAAWPLLSCPNMAWGATSGIVVDVRCPPLPEETISAFDARARADLAVSGIEGGALSVACAHGVALISLRLGAGRELAQTALLAFNDEATIDHWLTVTNELVTALRPSDPPSPMRLDFPSRTHDPPIVHSVQAPPVGPPFAPARESVFALALRGEGIVGLTSQPLHQVGAQALILLSPGAEWDIGFGGGYRLGIPARDGFSASALVASLRLQHFSRTYKFAFSTGLEIARWTFDNAKSIESSQSQLDVSIPIGARYGAQWRDYRVLVGPDVRIEALPWRVTLSDVQSYATGVASVSLIVEGAWHPN